MSVDPADAQLVRDIVRERAAISLDASKDYLIESRLENLVRTRGFPSLGVLLERARLGELQARVEIVEAMTTHETSFFRDCHPFEVLRRLVLPPLIAARRARKQLTIWSAACSTGQEPYSLAMLLLRNFPELADWRPRIVGTDISEQVIARARTGEYSQYEVLRGLPAPMLADYFDRSGTSWVAKPVLRDLVELRQLNLLDIGCLPFSPDIVLMRNVLIYFDLPVRRTILDHVRRQIAPDGVLMLGASESVNAIADGWDTLADGSISYFKVRP